MIYVWGGKVVKVTGIEFERPFREKIVSICVP